MRGGMVLAAVIGVGLCPTVLLNAHLLRIPHGTEGIVAPTSVAAIFCNSAGALSELSFTYTPALRGIEIPAGMGGEGNSLFFPLFDMGFLWWKGFWVNSHGNYWTNGQELRVSDVNWARDWNTYWYQWNSRWHAYWAAHKEDSHWPYHDEPYWAVESGAPNRARLQPPKSKIWGGKVSRSSEQYAQGTAP